MLARPQDRRAAPRVPAPDALLRRGRLYRRLATLLVALVASALTVTAAVEAWYSFLENRSAQVAIQREKAQGAAAVIEQFLKEIEGQLGWTTLAGTLPGASSLDQRRLDFLRLLRQAPPITEVTYIDPAGREQLRVSRLAMDALGAGTDRSQDAAFREALASGRHVSPVYFRKESEPYLTLAITGSSRRSGVVVAEVNLKFIWDVISRIKVGTAGIAYAVDDRGLLIAHPDIGLVLRKSDFSKLAQVQAGPSATSLNAPALATDWMGREVLTANATVEPTGWRVFVEQPTDVAFAPLRDSLLRTGILSLLGIVIAALLGLWLAHRLTVPIEALARAAARIGAGDLGHRIPLATDDEAEVLARSLNDMASRLQESYSGLERTVAERTEELSRTVSEMKALSEVGQAVSSSLDLKTVLGTILSHACRLSETDGGAVYVLDGTDQKLSFEAGYNLSEALLTSVRAEPLPIDGTTIGRAAREGVTVEIPDLAAEDSQPVQAALLAAGIRALLAVPLRHQGRPIGVLVTARTHIGPFDPATVALLETFAAQSTIAVNNARLFRALEEQGEKLRIASLHKSQFLANMSHELRTPLNAILGYSELIQDGVYGPLPPKVGSVLERVQTNGRHLLGLINDVLDLSKIEAGQLVLRLEDYSMSDLVQTAVSTTESLAREKGLAMKISIAENMPVGRGDAQRITQVVLNLLGNAIKFSDSGEVRIAVRAKARKFVLTVADTGPGIPPEEQTRIFEEFHQVDNSNTKKKGGTGLGLAISRRIISLHGGRLGVESESGRGSVFRVDLPVRVEQQRGLG